MPDLADGEPEISEDKKTVTVKISKGVKFGPPVNREVTSKDIKYAFERFFTQERRRPVPGYFARSRARRTSRPSGVKPISGITTPDDNTIVFKLKEAAASRSPPRW